MSLACPNEFGCRLTDGRGYCGEQQITDVHHLRDGWFIDGDADCAFDFERQSDPAERVDPEIELRVGIQSDLMPRVASLQPCPELAVRRQRL